MKGAARGPAISSPCSRYARRPNHSASLVLITIGSVTASPSPRFHGGLLPGVVLAVTLSALVWWPTATRIAPRHACQRREIAKAFLVALPRSPAFVIRYPWSGIATATEVSTSHAMRSSPASCLRLLIIAISTGASYAMLMRLGRSRIPSTTAADHEGQGSAGRATRTLFCDLPPLHA